MISGSLGAFGVLATVLAALALPVALIWLLSGILRVLFSVVRTVFSGVGGLLGRVVGFVREEATDALQFAGGLLTGGVIAPLAVGNLAIGRVRTARHFGRAIEDEFMGAAISLYRLGIGNPARFLGLGPLTAGLENRLPDLVAGSPEESPRLRRAAAAAARAKPEFEGYTVTGELPAGGSGARLYLARPSQPVRARYASGGLPDPGQVVVKSFALVHGSTLPQIVRESRALAAARRLGLVLDHELTEDSFWYAMPFVPGDDLDVVTRRMHARAEPEGLGRRGIQKVLGHGSDLLTTLDRFHREGLWHKDIKPSNLIVSGDRVHLVDLGLVTPLASAMTLTTHGTEYFRDPELVRRAMQGVKVHEVDGVKFDLYSAGAVLYSMIENSFPAHGSLSRFSKRCPDALAFVVRRAMADIDERYSSAAEMERDIAALLAAPDAFTMRPADLPSMGGAAPRARLAGLSRARRDERVDLETFAGAAAPMSPSPAPTAASRREPATGPAPRRKRRRGVLVAIVAFFLFTAIGNSALFVARSHESVASVARAQAASLKDRIADLRRSRRRPAATPPRPESRRAAAPLPTGTVLLLRDPAVSDLDPEFVALRQTLAASGVEVLDETSAHADAIDLVAGGRRAVELAPLSDPDAGRRLEDFLRRTPALDGVLWIGTGTHADGLLYRSFERRPTSR